MQASDATIEIAGRTYANTGRRANRFAQALLAIEQLKEVSNDTRLHALEILDQRFLHLLNDKIFDFHSAMTWDQLRGLGSMGMEIGSHSITHPLLSRLSDEDLKYELFESRRRLQEETGQPIIALSYPVGREQDYDKRTLREARLSGYQFGCSYVSGNNHLDKLDSFQLCRLHVESHTTRARFIAMLTWPELMG
jgi:peptidoglycan/xylan/chitin deacetylase (PgdA/CDA1 family)